MTFSLYAAGFEVTLHTFIMLNECFLLDVVLETSVISQQPLKREKDSDVTEYSFFKTYYEQKRKISKISTIFCLS